MLGRSLLAVVVSAPLFTACMVERDYATQVDGLDAVSLPAGEMFIRQSTLEGDIGPVDGLRGEGVGSGWRDEGFAQIQVDGRTDRGTAFVVFYLNDMNQLRSLRGQGPVTIRSEGVADEITAQGCSDTFDGEHYDAVADEIVLEVEEVDAETLNVDYEIISLDGDLTDSPQSTTATGSFQVDFGQQ